MDGQEKAEDKEPTTTTPGGGGRQDNINYKADKGEIHTKEDIEQHEGYYDEDGFYVMGDGSFYDPNGYYFDQEGYDEFGGYYENGYYVPGPDYAEEYYRRFNEVYGQEDDECEYDIEDYFSEEENDEEYPEEGTQESESLQK